MAGVSLSILTSLSPEYRNLPVHDADEQIKKHIKNLTTIHPGQLRKRQAENDPLEILPPDIHSISYLYILVTRVSALRQSKSWKTVPPQLQPDGELWGLIVTFL
ncbi:hypothetical protein LTS18_013475, partial [Coniosporium uncinatum]